MIIKVITNAVKITICVPFLIVIYGMMLIAALIEGFDNIVVWTFEKNKKVTKC